MESYKNEITHWVKEGHTHQDISDLRSRHPTERGYSGVFDDSVPFMEFITVVAWQTMEGEPYTAFYDGEVYTLVKIESACPSDELHPQLWARDSTWRTGCSITRMWEQVRVDHGTEFCPLAAIQWHVANFRQQQTRLPILQTTSTNNHRVGRMCCVSSGGAPTPLADRCSKFHT